MKGAGAVDPASEIEHRALLLLDRARLLCAPVPMVRLAQAVGMHVSLATFRDPRVTGALQVVTPRAAHAWINGLEGPTRQRFVLAHLLGHWQLHAAEGEAFSECHDVMDVELRGEASGAPEESAANQFAAAVLMPAPMLEEFRLRGCRDPVRLAEVFRVAVHAMQVRLAASETPRRAG